MSYRLGKHVPRHDARTLMFHKYAAALPVPPPAVNFFSKVGTWGMDLNDQLGDCVCAAYAHAVLQWTTYAGAAALVPTSAQVLATYEAIGGYVPGDPNTDNGCDMLTACNYWRQTGMAGQKVAAFVKLETGDWNELQAAVALFGNCYIGVSLPDWTVPNDGTDWTTIAWTTTGAAGQKMQGDPANGHCVLATGYDGVNGWVGQVISWGAKMYMDRAFYEACSDEAYALLSEDWIKASGEAPSGFDMAQLQADLAAITTAAA